MRANVFALLTLVIATSPACTRSAGSSEWPTRPVKVVVPFGPGSGVRMSGTGLSSNSHMGEILNREPTRW